MDALISQFFASEKVGYAITSKEVRFSCHDAQLFFSIWTVKKVPCLPSWKVKCIVLALAKASRSLKDNSSELS